MVISSDIELEISLLRSKKASGLYSCPIRVLKCAKNVFSLTLPELINLSVQTGKYLSKLKHIMQKLFQDTKTTMRPTLATTVLFRYFPFSTGFLKKLCTTD